MTATQQSDKFTENLVPRMPEITHHHRTARKQDIYGKS
jgi:hypothetical protein